MKGIVNDCCVNCPRCDVGKTAETQQGYHYLKVEFKLIHMIRVIIHMKSVQSLEHDIDCICTSTKKE